MHRDEEIKLYTNSLQDIVEGHEPNNVFVYGPTGVGKTAVTKWMREKLEEEARKRDVPLSIVGPINCRHYKTAYRLVTAIVNDLRSEEEQIAQSGHSTDRVFQFLYEEIESMGGNVLLILDEIDNIPPDARNDFLYDLPRAEANEDTPIDDAKVGLIGISNDLKFVDTLEPKVKSTLGEREIEFGPYDANQLRDILTYYADLSFEDGVLEEEVVPLAAAFAAQERGDVRQGLRILEKAGEYARMEGSATVTEANVRKATENIETDEILDYFEDKLSIQQGLSYISATLMVIEPQKEARTKHIYNLYTKLAATIGADEVSERKFYEFLDQLCMLGLARSTERNLGRKGGRTYIYEVTDDPEDIIRACEQEDRLSKVLPSNVYDILEHYQKGQATSYQAPDGTDPEQRDLFKFG
ncbi:Cdc6/Cdc18 family protein [Halospeciosus flavus]